MGEVKWTKEQKQAIESKDANILVAAAAGSGKTAVLVERIIHKIIEEKMDIDKLLVVTFTNSAAAEMRERILKEISQKLEEQPGNQNLQKQLLLLNKANISTIHAFCLEVIKNHFYEIDCSPNFKIGETAEIELLKADAMEELFEEKYEQNDTEFSTLLDTYTSYKGDEPLKEIIMQIYEFMQSSPFPEEWLEEKIEMFHIQDINQDFSENEYGKILLEENKKEIELATHKLQKIWLDLKEEGDLKKYELTIMEDIETLENLKKQLHNWDSAYQAIQNIAFPKWPIDRKIESEVKEKAKLMRTTTKDKLMKKLGKVFIYTSEEINEDMLYMYQILKYLQKMILDFKKKYQEKKKEKNIMDFNDIEHNALKILVRKDENGVKQISEVAKEYQEKFEEIAIDEYQDSNLVQEYILNAVSRGNNIFMVGDVKQSIYKFRQAKPELFLEKYQTFEKEKANEKGLMIQLFNNFRSKTNILDITNLIFQNIMSKELGEIEYDEKEYLNSISQEAEENLLKSEMHIIDLQETEKQEEVVEDMVLEARFAAQKIKEIVKSGIEISDKKEGRRKITYKDIVVLLRATTVVAPIYEKEMIDLGIPTFSDTSAEYLDSIEVQTIMSVLKIMDNPYNDIALVTVLRSYIGGFTDEDLVSIRLIDRKSSYYETLKKYRDLEENTELNNKVQEFLQKIENWREDSEYMPLEELLWKIYLDTGYYHYVSLMPNGILRQANLKMLFQRAKEYEKASFKGLFHFVKFIDKIKTGSGDLGAAKLIGENANVVRIMSIHKSKGLEFPVVFLCNVGKQFNMMDLNKNLLLHQELGIGVKYINYENKIEYNIPQKEAIRIKTRKEILSEEMRVLYVALTRAKEKLVVIGATKNVEEELEKKRELINVYKENNSKLTPFLVSQYESYLDWITLVWINEEEKMKKLLEMHVYPREEVINNFEKQEKNRQEHFIETAEKITIDEKIWKQLQSQLNWQYPYEKATKMAGKTSVSKLKQEETLPAERIPKFLLKEDKISSAEKGTLMHLCFQKLNLKEDYTKEEIEELIEKLIIQQIITEEQARVIDRDKIWKFTQSSLAKEVRESISYEKEMPFYLTLSAKEAYGEEIDEDILVQGIIDLYYINAKGELVLVDYKTDFVKQETELVEKYQYQLQLYQKALEKALEKKVARIYIYSTCLEKAIPIDIM